MGDLHRSEGLKRSPLKRGKPLERRTPLRQTTPLACGELKPTKRRSLMAVAYGKGWKGKATRLHAELVRARGRCERCGSVDGLQCAHIVSRRFSATRTDLTNAWCLCAKCHRRLTDWPHEHVAFAHQTHGEAGFRALCDRAQANGRPWSDLDWRAEHERLALLGKEKADG